MHIHPSHSTVHRKGSRDDVAVPFTRVALTNGETFDRYATAGPGSDPEVGLPALRSAWVAERGDTEEYDGREAQCSTTARRPCAARRPASSGAGTGHDPPWQPGRNVTQMHYARRGEITAEMQFVALREGIAPSSSATRSRAGARSSRPTCNHPEAEPMIIGRNFLVKINANIGNSAVTLLHRRGGREDDLGDPLGRRHRDGPVDRRATSTPPASGSSATPRCRSAPCRSIRRWRRSTATPPS